MLNIVQIYILLIQYFITARCEIPSLSVRKVDSKIIERKRQDTLEMCRIFNGEITQITEDNQYKNDHHHRRVKRHIETTSAKPQISKQNVDIIEALKDEKYEESVDNVDEQTSGKKNLHEDEGLSDEKYNDSFDSIDDKSISVKPLLGKNNNNKTEELNGEKYNDSFDSIDHKSTSAKSLLKEKNDDKIEIEDEKYVSYAKGNVTTTKAVPDGLARRFDFAPATLLPPDNIPMSTALPDTDEIPNQTDEPSETSIPWIKKWKHGLIPFYIDPKSYDSYLADIIINAFDYIEKATCIRIQRLRERPVDKKSLKEADWLLITNPAGIRQCVHSNERNPNLGVQVVVIGYNCMSLGEIAHEIMHVLGFSHEHTRSDRDQYINVVWNNIKPGYKKYFDLQKGNPLSFLPYDYESVLHYPGRAFSKNGKLTITAPPGKKIGQRESLSQTDVVKVSTIYRVECTERNKDYLLKTCPSVVTQNREKGKSYVQATPQEIKIYFEDRLWPFGVVNYKFKDNIEFSTEEIENIRTVFDHIEKETCIEFRDVTDIEADEYIDDPPLVVHINSDSNTSLGYQPTDQRIELVLDVSGEKNATRAKSREQHMQLSLNAKDEPLNILENEIVHYEAGEPKKVDRRHLAPIANNSTTPKQHEPTGKRRHSGNIMVLRRSSEQGCRCPSPGKPKGYKQLEIGIDCFASVNDLLHFFVHVLGLDHQHNTHDRDSFIHIVWDQLSPDLKNEMQKKYPPAASAGFAYDYQSVMHFPWLQIKDGVTSLMYPIWNDGWAMGHWQGLSTTDVKKINKIYERECLERSQGDKFTILPS